MLKDLENGWHHVQTEKNIFAIRNEDEHTSLMLSDFKSDPNKLAEFETLLDHDVTTAYDRYNNIPIPEKKTDAEIFDQRAKEFSFLMAQGKHEEAFYSIHGAEKADLVKEK